MTQHISFESLKPQPWKNGGGSTVSIAISPPDASLDNFDWRVSLATIHRSGPFSSFPGVDRSLVLLGGPGVMLRFDGARTVWLNAEDPSCAFPGEAAVVATVGEDPTIDFNVMTRRARCKHTVSRHRVSGQVDFASSWDQALIFMAEGEGLLTLRDGERVRLSRWDALLLGNDETCALECAQALVFVVEFRLV